MLILYIYFYVLADILQISHNIKKIDCWNDIRLEVLCFCCSKIKVLREKCSELWVRTGGRMSDRLYL